MGIISGKADVDQLWKYRWGSVEEIQMGIS